MSDLNTVVTLTMKRLTELVPLVDHPEDLLHSTEALQTLVSSYNTDEGNELVIPPGDPADDLFDVIKAIFDELRTSAPNLKNSEEVLISSTTLHDLVDSVSEWINIYDPPNGEELLENLRKERDEITELIVGRLGDIIESATTPEEILEASKSTTKLLSSKVRITEYEKLYYFLKLLNDKLDAVDEKHKGISDELRDNIENNASSILQNAANLTAHKNDKDNPHDITKAQVGLGNVPNYSATDSLTDGSSSKTATAKATKTLKDTLDALDITATTRKINTTAPLTGGGDLSADRTLSIRAATVDVIGVTQLNDSINNTSVSQSATANAAKKAYDRGSSGITKAEDAQESADEANAAIKTHAGKKDNPHGVTAAQTGALAADAKAADSAKLDGKTKSEVVSEARSGLASASRKINTTAPVTGGGDLTADRTIAVATATASAKGVVQTYNDVDSTSETLVGTAASVKKAYDRGSLGVSRSVRSPSALSKDTDLNTLNSSSHCGVYYQSANSNTTGNNYPVERAGALFVCRGAGVIQIYREYDNSREYQRTYYNEKWSSWVLKFDKANAPSKDDVGLGKVDNVKQAPTTRKINTKAPVTGGGDLTADRTIAVSAGTVDAAGILQLSNSHDSSSTSVAATANAAKKAYDRGSSGITKAEAAQKTADTAKSSVDGHVAKTDNPHKVTAAQAGALAVGARAADSAKLEGKTKSEVVSEARKGVVTTGRKINTTAPVTGGGDLSADRTIAVSSGTTSDEGVVRLSDAVDSTSTKLAATANASKKAYDRGSSGITKAEAAQKTADTAKSTADTAKSSIDGHVAKKDNPHGVTKSQVGLDKVDNLKQVPTTRKINSKGLDADITLNSSDVKARSDTWNPKWGDVSEKPSTFTPSAHKHDIDDLTDIGKTYSKFNIDNIPSSPIKGETLYRKLPKNDLTADWTHINEETTNNDELWHSYLAVNGIVFRVNSAAVESGDKEDRRKLFYSLDNGETWIKLNLATALPVTVRPVGYVNNTASHGTSHLFYASPFMIFNIGNNFYYRRPTLDESDDWTVKKVFDRQVQAKQYVPFHVGQNIYYKDPTRIFRYAQIRRVSITNSGISTTTYSQSGHGINEPNDIEQGVDEVLASSSNGLMAIGVVGRHTGNGTAKEARYVVTVREGGAYIWHNINYRPLVGDQSKANWFVSVGRDYFVIESGAQAAVYNLASMKVVYIDNGYGAKDDNSRWGGRGVHRFIPGTNVLIYDNPIKTGALISSTLGASWKRLASLPHNRRNNGRFWMDFNILHYLFDKDVNMTKLIRGIAYPDTEETVSIQMVYDGHTWRPTDAIANAVGTIDSNRNYTIEEDGTIVCGGTVIGNSVDVTLPYSFPDDAYIVKTECTPVDNSDGVIMDVVVSNKTKNSFTLSTISLSNKAHFSINRSARIKYSCQYNPARHI